ncbi:glycosyltransferase [Nesterenkonia xinjiangensis]|uniref:D-inositol 3-phosphate glycosyltransferase n=1 Tax=Nesterenkonia xinjiangensis TaxID=225327 RepID=A0A7Z0GPC5_9MICC|nr:glycosyltransferase [Nesterenkonia xinjiangensis]NYJ79604.1 D-inositol-3-phosphate glycosyltransferase [Nesterenkonia xinjiangensis]
MSSPTATLPCGGTSALRIVMVSLHTSPLAQAGAGDAGGLNVYVNSLSRALRAAGVCIDLVTTGEGPDHVRELADGRRVHHLQAGTDGDKNSLVDETESLAQRALRSLAAVDPGAVTTVHSHYWISGLAGLTMARRLRAPLVHTMHTIGAVKQECDPQAAEDPRRDAAESRIARSADMLTANTLRERDDLVRLFDVKPAGVALVRPGVDLSVFHPPAGEDARLHLEGRPLRLTFAGRLQPHKGPQVAVAALGKLRRMMPDTPVELTVAGRQSGQDALDIAELAAAHGVEDLVRTTDPLPHPQLADLFRDSDAVLMPSYSESFGLVALEAMACGTPVLAHDVGGLSELVRHQRTGRLVQTLDPAAWAEEMRWLILHRRAWARYSGTAAVLAEEYSWAATATASRRLYRTLSPVSV